MYQAGASLALRETTTPASVLGGRDQGKSTDTQPRDGRRM